MPLTGTLTTMTLDKAAYLTFFDAKMVEILKSSVRVWLAIAVSKIPVWSGMSRGTLLKLAEQVGYNVAIFPTIEGQRREPGGIDDGRLNSVGELIITRPKYGMLWVSRVRRLNTNEKHNVNPKGFFHLVTPGAYHFRIEADRAFKRAASAALRRFKFDVKRSVKIKTIRIG